MSGKNINVKETSHRSWAVQVDGCNTTSLKASAENGLGKYFNIEARKQDAGTGVTAIDIQMSADDFSAWSAMVLAKLREDGWRPKR